MSPDASRLPLSVVIIDDDPDDLLLLSRTLVKTGIADTLRTFGGATEAVSYLESLAHYRAADYPRVVVLCDLKMPTLDGFGFLDRIRARNFSVKNAFGGDASRLPGRTHLRRHRFPTAVV